MTVPGISSPSGVSNEKAKPAVGCRSSGKSDAEIYDMITEKKENK